MNCLDAHRRIRFAKQRNFLVLLCLNYSQDIDINVVSAIPVGNVNFVQTSLELTSIGRVLRLRTGPGDGSGRKAAFVLQISQL